jgi:hypothetical protein
VIVIALLAMAALAALPAAVWLLSSPVRAGASVALALVTHPHITIAVGTCAAILVIAAGVVVVARELRETGFRLAWIGPTAKQVAA